MNKKQLGGAQETAIVPFTQSNCGVNTTADSRAD